MKFCSLEFVSPGRPIQNRLVMTPALTPVHTSRGYRVHTLLCRGSGLPLFFLLSPANVHDAPFARRLLEWARHLYQIRPRVIRLDAAYWGLRLIAWIHATLHAVAVIPWNPKPTGCATSFISSVKWLLAALHLLRDPWARLF